MAIKTHYDTLKVTQDAPAEVIAAAYKALAHIYHPDKNAGNPQAMTLMQNVNVSYKILSDPEKRAEHDRWIKSQERRSDRAPAEKRVVPTAAAHDLKAKADKAAAEAAKWSAWSDKASREAKEAAARAEKAVADRAQAKAGEAAKWDAWVAKTTQEAKEANDRAEKAAGQYAAAAAEALEAAGHLQKTGNT